MQMPFTGVPTQNSRRPRGAKYSGARRDRARQLRDVVAERFAEAPGFEEVALHVDDDQRRCGPVELDRLRLRGKQAGGC